MPVTKILSRLRVTLLVVPIFGLASATQVGCEFRSADGIGLQGPESNSGYGRYGNAGEYGDDDGFDGYVYP